jgi:prepilin-type N-terminal cleavage/methylation domain-containing protein
MAFRSSKKGFTLVETLVVCVIVAILAAVSIPVYIGYVNNQKQVTVNNLAETAAASANSILRKTGAAPTLVSQLNLYYNATKYTVTINTAPNSVTVTDASKTTITSTVNY